MNRKNIVAFLLCASLLFGCARGAATATSPVTGNGTFAVPTMIPSTLDPNVPTFYVATDGNDENGNGSAAAPWATISPTRWIASAMAV